MATLYSEQRRIPFLHKTSQVVVLHFEVLQLLPIEHELVFLKDHLFSSPSAAGCALVGGENNGRTSWRNGQGQSISDLEQLAIAPTSIGVKSQ